jgi:hypothetical protein
LSAWIAACCRMSCAARLRAAFDDMLIVCIR